MSELIFSLLFYRYLIYSAGECPTHQPNSAKFPTISVRNQLTQVFHFPTFYPEVSNSRLSEVFHLAGFSLSLQLPPTRRSFQLRRIFSSVYNFPLCLLFLPKQGSNYSYMKYLLLLVLFFPVLFSCNTGTTSPAVYLIFLIPLVVLFSFPKHPMVLFLWCFYKYIPQRNTCLCS